MNPQVFVLPSVDLVEDERNEEMQSFNRDFAQTIEEGTLIFESSQDPAAVRFHEIRSYYDDEATEEAIRKSLLESAASQRVRQQRAEEQERAVPEDEPAPERGPEPHRALARVEHLGPVRAH